VIPFDFAKSAIGGPQPAALNVKQQILKTHPNLKITTMGSGIAKNPLCVAFSNQCVVVKK
jgi:hypothetical protein